MAEVEKPGTKINSKLPPQLWNICEFHLPSLCWERQSRASKQSFLPAGCIRVRMGLGPGTLTYQEVKSRLSPQGLSPCAGASVPVSDLMCAPLFYLSVAVRHRAPGQPHCYICPLWGRDSVLLSAAQEVMCARRPMAARRDPQAMGDRCPLPKLSCPVPSLCAGSVVPSSA